MITIIEALSWLKQFETSHLRRTTQALVRHITDLQTPEDKRRQMIASAIRNSRSYSDRFELPELLLQIAEVKYRQGNFKSAREYANAAVQIYTPDSHNLAAARWILGIIAWKLSDPKLAYSSWYYAREIFEKLASEAERQNDTEKVRWYNEQLEKINVELVCSPEETYTWLDVFEPSRLSKAAQQINNTLIEKLENNNFQDVYLLVENLKTLGSHSADHVEEAEILVECALAVYRMGNIQEAVRLLQKALGRFEPESHHQAVARWLLGILYWELPDQKTQAIAQWEKSLENFDQLGRKSDQQNLQSRLVWYRSHRNTMSEALNKKIRENLGS